MDLSRGKDESITDYLKRIDKKAQEHFKNIEGVFSDMKNKGIKGFCTECGCDVYKDKKHER